MGESCEGRKAFPWNLLESGEAFFLSSFLWVGTNTPLSSGVPLMHGNPGEDDSSPKSTSALLTAPGGALKAPDTVLVTDGNLQLFLRGGQKPEVLLSLRGQLRESE